MRLLRRIVGRETELDGVHRRCDTRRIDVRSETHHGLKYRDRLPERRRQPEASAAEIRIGEAVRHHADDRRRHAVHGNRFAERGRVAAEPLHEHIVGDDGHSRTAGRLFVRCERPADERTCAHKLEESWRHVRVDLALQPIDAGQRNAVAPDESESFDGVADRRCLRLPVAERWERWHARLAVFASLVDRDESIGGRVRHATQQHRVDHTEHRRRRTDAEHQGEHGDDGECRGARKRAQRVTKIVHHGLLGLTAPPACRTPILS